MASHKHFDRLKEYAPATGEVRILRLTEKQYANITYLTGCPDEGLGMLTAPTFCDKFSSKGSIVFTSLSDVKPRAVSVLGIEFASFFIPYIVSDKYDPPNLEGRSILRSHGDND